MFSEVKKRIAAPSFARLFSSHVFQDCITCLVVIRESRQRHFRDARTLKNFSARLFSAFQQRRCFAHQCQDCITSLRAIRESRQRREMLFLFCRTRGRGLFDIAVAGVTGMLQNLPGGIGTLAQHNALTPGPAKTRFQQSSRDD
jgi:hypothetical protein